MTTAVQLGESAPNRYEFVVDEHYLRLVTRAELRRRFTSVYGCVRPLLWLALGIWAFSLINHGLRLGLVLLAVSAFLLYVDTIGLLFSYPRALAKNTSVGATVGVGFSFGDSVLHQRNGSTSSESSLDEVAGLVYHSNLLKLLFIDGLHTYYPADLIPHTEVDRINRQLDEHHAD